MKTAILFIDGANLFYDWRNITNGQSNLDIAGYIELIKTKYPTIEIKRTYYFSSETTSNIGFLQSINRIPYCEVKRGRLQDKQIDLSRHSVVCSCGKTINSFVTTKIDKGTDVNIAVEMLKHAYNDSYDVAILVSRDADFSSVVRIVKDLGKVVELVLFDEKKESAKELSDNVDHITIIKKEDCMGIERINTN